MKPKLILDLDGTLIDDSLRHWSIFCHLTGLNISKEEYWKKRRTGLSNRLLLQHLAQAEFNSQEFLDLIESKEYLALDKLLVSEISLSAWRAEFDLILCTVRSKRNNCEWQLKKLGIYHYFFHIVIISHDELIRNGNDFKWPSLINVLAMSEEDVIIGDTEVDILTGKRGGIKTIAVESGIRSKEVLKAYQPDNIIENINQLVI